MKTPLWITLTALGGSVLFGGSLVSFALLRGAAPQELPLLGGLLDRAAQPEAEARRADAQAREENLAPAPPRSTRRASLGVFDVFELDSPLTSAELTVLADELKAKRVEADRLLETLREREAHVQERLRTLDEQHATLQRIRTQLESWEAELAARDAELDRDESARAAREAERWGTLAELFADGDPEELSTRLLEYEPEDAARVLAALGAERARALLAALPEARWKDYAEAYSRAQD